MKNKKFAWIYDAALTCTEILRHCVTYRPVFSIVYILILIPFIIMQIFFEDTLFSLIYFLGTQAEVLSDKIYEIFLFFTTMIGDRKSDYYALLGLIILFFVALTVSRYLSSLNKEQKTNADPISYTRALSAIQTRLDNIDKTIQATSPSIKIRPNERERIISAVSDRLPEEIAKEKIRSKSQNWTKLDDAFLKSMNRLADEARALAGRGNLNLIIGITTAASGVLVLSHYLFFVKIDVPLSMTASEAFYLRLSEMLPRLSLVIVIEVVSFFFLRLYRQSVMEIKFFQNEMTNMESRYISVKGLMANEDYTALSDIMKTIALTERNFILKKGESTIALREREIASETTSKLLSTIKQAIESTRK